MTNWDLDHKKTVETSNALVGREQSSRDEESKLGANCAQLRKYDLAKFKFLAEIFDGDILSGRKLAVKNLAMFIVSLTAWIAKHAGLGQN